MIYYDINDRRIQGEKKWLRCNKDSLAMSRWRRLTSGYHCLWGLLYFVKKYEQIKETSQQQRKSISLLLAQIIEDALANQKDGGQMGVGIDKLTQAMDALSEGLGMDVLDECNVLDIA